MELSNEQVPPETASTMPREEQGHRQWAQRRSWCWWCPFKIPPKKGYLVWIVQSIYCDFPFGFSGHLDQNIHGNDLQRDHFNRSLLIIIIKIIHWFPAEFGFQSSVLRVGLRISSISTTWELGNMYISGVHLRLMDSKVSGMSPWKPISNHLCPSCLRICQKSNEGSKQRNPVRGLPVFSDQLNIQLRRGRKTSMLPGSC